MTPKKQRPKKGSTDAPVEFVNSAHELISQQPLVVTGDTTVENHSLILVDTSQGAITVTLGSALLASGRRVEIVDDAGQASANPITVATEGSATIEPGGAASKTIAVDWAELELVANDEAAHWRALGRNQDLERAEAEMVETNDLNDEVHIFSDEDITSQISSNGGDTRYVIHGEHLVSIDASDNGIGPISSSNIELNLAADCTLKLADNELGSGDEGRILVIGDGSTAVQDVTISGSGTIDANRANQTGGTKETSANIYIDSKVDDVEIKEITLTGMVGDAILPEGTDSDPGQRLHVHDCTIHDGVEGILWKHFENVLIENNIIYDIDTQDAIEPHIGGLNWKISGNYLHCTGGACIDAFGGAQFGLIQANICERDGTGIGIEPGSFSTFDPVKDVKAIGNIIRNVNTGIRFRANDANEDERMYAIANLIEDPSSHGIRSDTGCTDVDIQSNRIRSPGNTGVLLNGTGDVRDNTILSPGSVGIQFQSDGLCMGNRVKNGSDKGIAVPASSEVHVLCNFVSGCGSVGIEHKGDHSLVHNNIAKNNKFQGIVGEGGDQVSIKSNLSFDDQGTATQDDGIEIRDDFSNSIVADNVTFGNGTTGIDDNSPASTTLRNNDAL